MIIITLKETIRKQILTIEALIKEEKTDPRWDFEFTIVYLNAPTMVIKPKKKDFLVISKALKFSENHKKGFEGLEPQKRMDFFKKLIKIPLKEGLEHRFDSNPKSIVIEIIDRIFIVENSMDINLFYRSLQVIHSCIVRCNQLVQSTFNEPINFDSQMARPDLYS